MTDTEPTKANSAIFGIDRKLFIGSVVILVILALLGTFFGYSYKKVTKENTTLKTEIDTLTKQVESKYSFTVTKEPVLLDGKVFYKTTTQYIKSTLAMTTSTHSTSVSIVTKTVTVTKKDFATFGVGRNLDQDICFTIQRNLIDTPIGNLGVELTPNITDFKKSCIFITYRL
jgi:hypothetical protein